MKNMKQSWKGLTEDLFNAHLFGETLFGSDPASDADDTETCLFEEMNYDDFVNLVHEEREMKRQAITERKQIRRA